MNKYCHLKARAIEWRKNGMALGEICEHLVLPKTTVYYWIKHIPIPRTVRQTAAQKIGTIAMQAKYAAIREQAYRGALADAKVKLGQPAFRDFVMLYITEGYRRTRNAVQICNSNVVLVSFATKWLKKLSNKKLRVSMQYHKDQNPEMLKHFWSKALGVKLDQVRISRKSNSGNLVGRKWRSEYGVASVGVGDTVLRSKLQGWMEVLQEELKKVI